MFAVSDAEGLSYFPKLYRWFPQLKTPRKFTGEIARGDKEEAVGDDYVYVVFSRVSGFLLHIHICRAASSLT